MNKDEFKDLSIKDQVKVINSMIRNYGSATKAIESLGYNESTIRRRFKNNGYILNNSKTAYISRNYKDITSVNNDSITKATKDTLSNNNNNTNVIKNDIIYDNKSTTTVIKNNDMETKVLKITKELQEFNKLKKDMLEMLEWYKVQRNKDTLIEIGSPEIKIDIDRIGNEKAVTKAKKIYTRIDNEFKMFCDNHKEFKLQDLMAMALIEYMDKYK